MTLTVMVKRLKWKIYDAKHYFRLRVKCLANWLEEKSRSQAERSYAAYYSPFVSISRRTISHYEDSVLVTCSVCHGKYWDGCTCPSVVAMRIRNGVTP